MQNIIILILSCKQIAKESELETDEPKEIISEQNPIIYKEESENGIEFTTCLKYYDFFKLKSLNGKTNKTHSNREKGH
jgi:hypothetical protein